MHSSEEERFLKIGEAVQSAIHKRQWLTRAFALAGCILLVLEAFLYKGPTDLRFAALYVLYVAVPTLLLNVGVVAYTAWRRWREGWFKEQAEIEALLAAAEARGEDPDRVFEVYMAEKHPFELQPPPSPPRSLSDKEIVQIHLDTAYSVELFWNKRFLKRLWVVTMIGAEEGFFFAPVALFGWPWWGMAISALIWGFMHYPIKNLWYCIGTSVFGTLVGLTVLPHGVLTNALGHFVHDYLTVFTHRFSSRILSKLDVE